MRVRDIFEIDFILFFSVITLIVVGILFIYSSGMTIGGELISTEYRRQIVWATGSVVAALVLCFLNYRKLYNYTIYFYLATLALLLYTWFFGRVISGGRWIRIGSFGIQISEFTKISTILFLAWFLDFSKRNQRVYLRFIISCIIVMVPMVIILIQPDLGTALVFIPILMGMTFMAKISTRYILFLALTIVFSSVFLVLPLWQATIMENAIPALMILVNSRFILASCLILSLITLISWFGYIRFLKPYFYWICYGAASLVLSLGASFAAQRVLREYQLMRLIVFMDPNVDPRGSGWHIIQSTTAIGSGGLFGRGYLQGTQSQYRYLPEQSTDFIFSILSEEWGFIGGLLVFTLFLIINLRLVRIMQTTADTFGSYIVAGLVSMFSFHFLINVGMTMGIMPITGIPLLFVSYGGSALLSAMLGIGLALSVHMRRYLHQ